MRNPLVSIACVTYNHENFIRQALDGFIMQKTDFPFEVLINDDASTDNTAEIIREYEKKFPEIIKATYQTENQFSKGVSVSENFLFPKIKGKYVAFCEGDDYWTDPFKLHKQVAFLESHPECSICFHPVKVVYSNDLEESKIYPTSKIRFYKTILSLNDLVQHNFIQTNSVMYRWRFNNKKSLDILPHNILPRDYYIHLLHAEKGYIGYIDEIMGVYRRHSGGLWWLTHNNMIEHHRKYGFQELNFFCCIDQHFNYQYTKIFTKNASIIASDMIKAFSISKEYEQLRRLQDEYKKYYQKALIVNRLKILKKIISAPERYLRNKIRFLFSRQ
jgi:glycosyltransferase involved in cell wall biosynthesis